MRLSNSKFLNLILATACGSLANPIASASNTGTAGCSSTCTYFTTTLGPSKVYPTTNNLTGSYYSAQEASLTPKCILLPSSITDVSLIVKKLSSINANSHGNGNGCKWAIEGGGHTPVVGGANINNGITVSLRALNSVVLSRDRKTVKIGGGALWGGVYDVLTPLGLSVAGGRNSEVGVGGLLTGGGISFFTTRKGFSCDNVIQYLVILGDGALITVSATENRPLFTALKGGSNNFGVVVQFTMNTFPAPNYLGGAITSPSSTLSAQVDALVNITTAKNFDPYTSIIFTIASVPQLGFIILNNLGYTSNDASLSAPPAPIAAFANIQPQLANTLRISNVSDFVNENTQAAAQINGQRNSFTTTTFRPTSSFILSIFSLFNTTLGTLTNTTIVNADLSFEPIPTAITSIPSSNSLGLSAQDANLMLLQISFTWISSIDDARINKGAQELVENIDKEAKKKGLFNEWKYLNYAAGFQKVIEGYGRGNVENLKRVSGEFDPLRVFQKDVPGGFKLDC